MARIKALLKRFFSEDQTDGWRLPIWFRTLLYFMGLIYLTNYSGRRMFDWEFLLVMLFYIFGLPFYVYHLREKIREYKEREARADKREVTNLLILEGLVEKGLILPAGVKQLKKEGLVDYSEDDDIEEQ